MNHQTYQYARALLEMRETYGEKRIETLANKFVQFLKKRGTLSLGFAILREYERLRRQKLGIRSIVVATAMAPSPDLSERVKAMLGGTLEIEECYEPSLLAGMRIIVNDELMIDGSLKSHIDSLLRG